MHLAGFPTQTPEDLANRWKSDLIQHALAMHAKPGVRGGLRQVRPRSRDLDRTQADSAWYSMCARDPVQWDVGMSTQGLFMWCSKRRMLVKFCEWLTITMRPRQSAQQLQ